MTDRPRLSGALSDLPRLSISREPSPYRDEWLTDRARPDWETKAYEVRTVEDIVAAWDERAHILRAQCRPFWEDERQMREIFGDRDD